MILDKCIIFLFSVLLFSCTGHKKDLPIDKKVIVEENHIYNLAEVDSCPEFIGENNENIMSFFAKNFQSSEQGDLQLYVTLEYIVDTLGYIDQIRVCNKETGNYPRMESKKESDYTPMDSEAVRVLRLTSSKWKPGYLKNKKVSVRMIFQTHLEYR